MMANSLTGQEQEKTYTYPELRRTFFPNVHLKEVEEELASDYNLPYPWQHDLQADEKDSRCGIVEIAKRSNFDTKERLQGWLRSFYQFNGYESPVENDGRDLILVNSKSEKFKASIFETGTSFRIRVTTL